MTDTNDDATGESNADATDAGRSSRRAWLQAIGLLGLAGVGSRSASAATGHFGEDWSGSASSDAGLEVYNAATSGSAIGLLGRSDSPDGYGVRSRGPFSVATAAGNTTLEVEASGTAQFATPVNNGEHEPMMRMFPGGTGHELLPVVTHSPQRPYWGLFYEGQENHFVFLGDGEPRVYVRLVDDPALLVEGQAHVEGVLETDSDLDVAGQLRTSGSWQVNVDGSRALELGSQSAGDAGKVVHGHASNTVRSGAVGATISGGGFDDGSTVEPNVVTDIYGTIGGGQGNQAGNDDSDTSNARYATVSGGQENVATSKFSSVGGGFRCVASGKRSTVAGGSHNEATGPEATVGGGFNNEATSEEACIAGGVNNLADGYGGAIGGGYDNNTLGMRSAVGGGEGNEALSEFSTIPGGFYNTAGGHHAFVAGGERNEALGGGSFAGGQFAKAADHGSFVWADGSDSQSDKFSSSDAANGSGVTGDRTFHVKSTGGVRMLTSAGTTFVPGGSTGWSVTSTRAAKTNVDPVDPEQVLDGVESLEVSTWEYESEDGEGAGVRHVGPMAEEFHDAFELGSSDEHINSVNADGVALAAIQGLSERLDDREERIETLEAENEALRDRLATLEAHVGLDAGDGSPAPADD